MRLLLDTQIALWTLTGSGRLGALAQGLIEDPAHEIFISTASVWEIAIKYALGRGDMPVSGVRAAELFTQAGYRELPIDQALTEPMRLLSRDAGLNRHHGTRPFPPQTQLPPVVHG